MNNHPQIAALYRIYQQENQSFRKAHRMIDLFESIIKSHTVLIIAEYVKHNKLSDAAKGLLAQGLRTPSLGTWQLFSRVLFEELEKDNYNWLFTDFAFEFAALDKALNIEKTNVIALRNGYAHGATPTDAQCEADIKKFEPFLTQLLESKWLNASSLKVRDHKVYLVCKAGELTLHPMLLFRNEESEVSFAFFNDLKNDKIGLLNYPLSKHYREKDFYTEFHEHLPLHEWKKTGNNEFYQRIEELTETFKGRTIEREKLLQFVFHNHKGYFSIQGNPGIGKSALIAQFFKDLRSHTEGKQLKVIEYFIRRGTQQAQVEYMFNYLIRRTDEVFPAGKEIRAEGKMVFDLQYQLFAKWRLWSEQANGQQLLFLIDGLDEGVENNVVTYLPRENFDNILIIYGSRPGGHKTIDDLWATLPVENHSKLELSGLGKEDIRALIYEVANKYEVERESAWIDAVQKRSQGNPLYLKLLCDAIENGSIEINDINALPEKIDEYYKAILQRYAQDIVDGDALLTGLFTFAAAKDYLTMAHLGLINKLGSASVQRIGSTLKEVLYENPLTEEVLDYQLFHESFREYLVKEKAKEVSDAAGRIIDFCNIWQELEGSWEQRYALEQYASHLFESKQGAHHETLIDLIYNKAFATEQMKTLKTFDASNRLYQLALLKASHLNKEDQMLEAALCLVDLKYEEANDAPQVVAMIANGEIELALKRIERFGGADEEGVKRKFILYMLCLMELTLLNSKEKPFRKSAIEKLLNHLDAQIPADTSLINWNDFFPSYTIFLMACEWVNMGLDYSIVYKRTNNWETDWLKEKGPYSHGQFELLLDCTYTFSDKFWKSRMLAAISIEQAKQGHFDNALICAQDISDEGDKSRSLSAISTELFMQGKNEEAESVIHEALSCARGNSSNTILELLNIATELSKQRKSEEVALLMQEVITSALDISDDYSKNWSLGFIAAQLAKDYKIEEALTCANDITDEYFKSSALLDIATILTKQLKVVEATSLMQVAITFASRISDEPDKSITLKEISTKLVKQGKLEEALECANSISDDDRKSSALLNIAAELTKKRKITEATSVIQVALTFASSISNRIVKSVALKEISTILAKQGKLEEAIECVLDINTEEEKNLALKNISNELAKQGQLEEALACARGITNDFYKSSAFSNIAAELARQEKIEEVESVMQKAIASACGINSESDKSSYLSAISANLIKQVKLEEALVCISNISNDYSMSSALSTISVELAKQHNVAEALLCARNISVDWEKSQSLLDISSEIFMQGKNEEAASVMQESLVCALSVSDDYMKSIGLAVISNELAKQRKIEDAASMVQKSLIIARGISLDKKTIALKFIFTALFHQGKKEEAVSVIQESLACIHDISDDYWKATSLENIVDELIKHDMVAEALVCAQSINSEIDKFRSIAAISVEMTKQGKLEQALECVCGIRSEYFKNSALKKISTILAKQEKLEEALECTHGINNEREKNLALKNISNELAKQEYWNLAEKIGLEITQIAIRQNCWKAIASSKKINDSWQVTLDKVQKLQNEEARLFYLKGWAEDLSVNETDNTCLKDALPLLAKDTYCIENVLQNYALHEVIYGSPSKELMQRLNKSLNVQWLIDIAAQFPKESGNMRLSTNLDTWLHEIEDEDDQDQITLWSKQVTKGKITEEEFQTRIKDI